MAHPHANEMMQFAQDAAETDKPWERWEVMADTEQGWMACESAPDWDLEELYRRIAKRRTFGDIEWLAPMTEAPANGTSYWVFDPTASDPINETTWADDPTDRKYLRRGIAFATEQAAQEAFQVFLLVFGGEE